MIFRRWYYLLYWWALPATLIGLVLAVIYRVHSWRWHDGCLEAIGGDRIWGHPTAQTHGWLIFYRNARARDDVELRVHERVHVVQGLFGGPFFVIAYGVCFCFYFLTMWDWYDAYMMVPFERQAYRLQTKMGWGS